MEESAERYFQAVAAGRCDAVLDLLQLGVHASARDAGGVSLLLHCSYYGDVSAVRTLLSQGASLNDLGQDLGLMAASFHGHWQLCQCLIEHGADPHYTDAGNGETALHSALCTKNRVRHDPVLRVLLQAGADPNAATRPGQETDGFMRDARTRGETPLHRAAAFGTEETIDLLLAAGANVEVRDAFGDSPLSWGSWHVRPDSILRKLCFGPYRVRPDRKSMDAYVTGEPLG